MPKMYPYFALILCIAGYFLQGCGPNLTIQLPNDHYLVVLNASDRAINSGADKTVTKWSVGELAHNGDVVYGTIVDADSQLLQEYFVLDTLTSTTRYYPDESSWAAALDALAIADHRLRNPSAFYNIADQLWLRAVLFGVVVLLVGVPVWIWRRAGKRAASTRMMRSLPGL